MKNTEIEQMLSQEDLHISKLHEIVQESIKNEELIVNNLLNPPKETLTRGQSISDRVARFGGSWNFIIAFGVILTLWIIYNILAPTGKDFDPYPFILMNLILSCIAALQAPVIMMSQNRKEEKDRMRSENDYLINMKAEMQIRSLHQKIDLLLEDQIKTLFDSQAQQLALLNEIKSRLKKFLLNNMSNRDKSPHILNASSNLLGLCFIVLTSIRILNLRAATFLDEIATVAIVMFMTSSILSFLSMRKESKANSRLEKIADIFFLAGLFMLFITAMFLSFNMIK